MEIARQISLLAIGSFLALACSGQSSAPPDSGCGDRPSRPGEQLVSLDSESRFEAEPFLVARNGDLAILWEASGCDNRTKVGYTLAGSAGSLAKPQYLLSPDGQQASNVTAGWDSRGSLFATWASWTPGPDPERPSASPSDIRIQLVGWPAGAAGFGPPIELSETIADQLYDKPWLLVTQDDVILVTYSDLVRGGIWAASSTDAGQSFRRVLVDSMMANLAASCPDGRPGGAFVTYFANRTIRLAHTSDGGASWSQPQTVAGVASSGEVAYHDPTCVANGDEVWVAYGRTHDDFSMPVERLLAVEVAHATLGATAPDTVVVALAAGGAAATDDTIDGGAPAAYLITPQLGRRPDGSLVLAAYHAASEDSGASALVVTFSTDGGRSFAPEHTLASGLTGTVVRHVPNWLGDYFGLGSTPAGVGAAFVDNASGLSHVAFIDDIGRPATTQ